nr:hypothetical protein [uncultured Chitinophaga sp.]
MYEFQTTIVFLKKIALASSVFLTDGDIAKKIGISTEKFKEYYTKDTAPTAVLLKLRDSYPQFLKGATYFKLQQVDDVDPEDPPTPPLTEEEKKKMKN